MHQLEWAFPLFPWFQSVHWGHESTYSSPSVSKTSLKDRLGTLIKQLQKLLALWILKFQSSSIKLQDRHYNQLLVALSS